MDKNIYNLCNKVKDIWCRGCDSAESFGSEECDCCAVMDVLNDLQNLDIGTIETNNGCSYCWDAKKKNSKEIFYFDSANNMRSADYCPACGRKY